METDAGLNECVISAESLIEILTSSTLPESPFAFPAQFLGAVFSRMIMSSAMRGISLKATHNYSYGSL